MTRNKKIVLFLFLTVAGFCWIYRGSIANLPMHILIRHDHPEKGADFIVIMMGNVMDRTAHAVQLYQQGYGKKILFAETEQSELIRRGFRTTDGATTHRMLMEAAVPQDAIIYLSHTRNSSSQEEVRTILDYLSEHDATSQRVILVTSWYHSSRAHWIMERINRSSVTIESFPSPNPPTWWGTEGDFLAVYNEYLKWAYYLIKY